MSFSWSEYLDVAEWLAQNAGTEQLPLPSEAVQRSAVSRAYYSAFQSALALLVQRGEYQPKGLASDHGDGVRCYRTHGAHPRRQIATWLERLRDRRRKADYEIQMADPAGAAKAS